MSTYQQPHLRQYDFSAITSSSGCTWTSAAMGVNAQSGGKLAPSPDAVKALVKRTEEVVPETPGWHLKDVKLAMDRLKVPFEVRTGAGWVGVIAASDAGYGIVLQGDSDQFSNATCSGAFDGDHAVFLSPIVHADGRRWLNDPICKTGRWESPRTLRLYAEKLYAKVRFGVFTTKVPTTEIDMTLFFKPDSPSLTGTATMDGPGHSIAAYDGRLFGNRPDGEAYTVVASGRLHDILGKPIGIDGRAPTLNRDVVFIIDRPEWGNSCYVLRADVRFTPDVAEVVVPPSKVACKPYVDAALASAVVEHRIVVKED